MAFRETWMRRCGQRWLAPGGWGILLAMAGCAGRDFGEDELVPVREDRLLPSNVLAGGPIHLPGDVPFNFTDTERHEEGGGVAESFVEEGGKARLLTEVKGEGNAWAQFRLGHVLPAGRDAPLEARVHFNVKYHYDTNRAWSINAPEDLRGRLVLKAYLLDSALNLVGREALADVNPFLAPESRSAVVTPIFRFTMAPDRAYHVMLSGRIELPGGGAEPVRCELVVDSAECIIEPLVAASGT